MAGFLHPKSWVSLKPTGFGETKPGHLREMVRVAWENRDELGYAWRILTDGVCDGCALGTTGLKDFTLDGVHLCTVRLNLLRLNTMGPLDPELLSDVGTLRGLSGKQLRELGRLPYPMRRRRGEPGFTRVEWDEAMGRIATRIRIAEPRRVSFYLTSRGITNEVYYVAQKVARFLGTNNVDNSSRICHAPSTTALKRSLGVAASTCSYRDWLGTDLLLLIGSDAANNQPVSTKYMYEAKRLGTEIVMINPYREPGLDRYWIPSIAESAVFGTRLTDHYFQIHQGGDVAFLNGVLKQLLEDGVVDEGFVAGSTVGFEEVRDALAAQSWDLLERSSGASRESMGELARLIGRARSAVFVWSMGITQHRFGVDNVQAIINLALARGFVGREKCGLMPIRGHSGVQGGAEMGAVPWSLPGGAPLGPGEITRLSDLWGFPVPGWRGLSAVGTVDAAHRGEIDVLYAVGGDYLNTLPDPDYCEAALRRVPLRVHQDIVLTHQMFVEPEEEVFLLPASTRYEQPGGGTETSTERRIYFSPEILGRRIGEARSEWEALIDVAARAHPERAHLIRFDEAGLHPAQAIRNEIARAVPAYEGIQALRSKGDAVQWGGERLCEDGFGTESGKAHFHPVAPPEVDIPEGWFHLSTRRGKQFNSMVQRDRDPLTGAVRDSVFMSAADAGRLGLGKGDPVVLTSRTGSFHGRCMVADIKERNVQVHWPEGNILIPRGIVEPESGIPDFTTLVRIEAREPVP